MQKILILGMNSYVGAYLERNLNNKFKFVGISRKQVTHAKETELILGDATNVKFIVEAIEKYNIDIVVNCVCIGNVDECEKNQELANRINFVFVKQLSEAVSLLGVKFVHFSSNAVYDGDSPLYTEDSPMNPKNYYGKLKANCDDFISLNVKNFLVIRVMTLIGSKFSYHRDNPATMIIKELKKKGQVSLVDDVLANLLYINDLTEIFSFLVENDCKGFFNAAGHEIISRYDLGLLISKEMGMPVECIKRCSSSDFQSFVPRALNTSFDTSKIKTLNSHLLTDTRLIIKKIVAEFENERN
jgi:dTDP-4-dehydrorhamnose reductase